MHQMDRYWNETAAIIAHSLREPEHSLNGIKYIKKKWSDKKGWMLDFFDEHGRISSDIPANQSTTLFTNHMSTVMPRIVSSLIDGKRKTSNRFAAFRHCDRDLCSIMEDLRALVNVESFINNKILQDVYLYPLRKIIPRNTKVTKVIPMYIDSLYPNDTVQLCNSTVQAPKELLVDFIVTLYSQIITSSRRGNMKLVLSVNPVDMILSSAHTSSWSTCHNIFEGEHRCGSLTYICDSYTIIAYTTTCECEVTDGINKYDAHNPVLSNGKPIIAPKKEWRRMMYIDPECRAVSLGKQYPEYIGLYDKISRRMAGELLQRIFNTNSKWFVSPSLGREHSCTLDDTTEIECTEPFTDAIDSVGLVYTDAPEANIWLQDGGSWPDLEVGTDELPCVKCGAERTDSASISLQCCHCGDHFQCGKCGNIYHSDEGCYLEHYHITVCEECLEDSFVMCPICYNTYDIDECYWSEDDDSYICNECFQKADYISCTLCGRNIRKDRARTATELVRYHDGIEEKEVHICLQCSRVALKQCPKCMNLYTRDSMSYTRDTRRLVCAKCVTCCDNCGCLFEDAANTRNNERCCVCNMYAISKR